MVKMGNVIAVWLLNLSAQLQNSFLRIIVQGLNPVIYVYTKSDVLKCVSPFF